MLLGKYLQRSCISLFLILLDLAAANMLELVGFTEEELAVLMSSNILIIVAWQSSFSSRKRYMERAVLLIGKNR